MPSVINRGHWRIIERVLRQNLVVDTQPGGDAECVHVGDSKRFIYEQSGTQRISWRNARQRVCAQGVELQDRVILPGMVAAGAVMWSGAECLHARG